MADLVQSRLILTYFIFIKGDMNTQQLQEYLNELEFVFELPDHYRIQYKDFDDLAHKLSKYHSFLISHMRNMKKLIVLQNATLDHKTNWINYIQESLSGIKKIATTATTGS